MKKIIIGFIVGALMFGIIPVMAEGELSVTPNPFPVVIDGVVAEVEGYNINGYTFLKLADIGKTGLTVKFNETDGQIEITSMEEKAVMMPVPEGEPVPEPVKGEKPVSDVEKFDENGYQGIRVDGVEYYSMKSMADSIYNKGYNVGYDKIKDGLFLIKYNNAKKSTVNSTKLLENIPYKVFDGATHIEKNYCLNEILPLVE